MKRTLILVIALISTLLVALGAGYMVLQRAERRREAALANPHGPDSPPSYAFARVSYSLAQVSVQEFHVLTNAAILDWQPPRPRPRRWWHDNNESMRIYRERVEAMKRTGSFRSFPTLQPSKVEGVMESNQ